MDNFNPYDVLGVSKNFTLEELKYNYKKVAKEFILIEEVMKNYLN